LLFSEIEDYERYSRHHSIIKYFIWFAVSLAGIASHKVGRHENQSASWICLGLFDWVTAYPCGSIFSHRIDSQPPSGWSLVDHDCIVIGSNTDGDNCSNPAYQL
jgi:hypothetical protein